MATKLMKLVSGFIVLFKLLKRGRQVVRIIHGKAHSNKDRQQTLKSHTNHWLKQMPDVLAFCSAPSAGGGTGSVLVLLKEDDRNKTLVVILVATINIKLSSI